MADLSVRMTGDEAKLFKSLARVAAQEKKVEDGLKKISRRGKQAKRSMGDAFGNRGLSQLTKFAGGVASITGALALGNRMFSAYIRNMEKISGIASQNILAARGFANLQPTELMGARTREMAQLMSRYGVKEFDQGFDAAQAFQSMYGSYKAGKAAAKTVFAASEYQIPLELGKEIEAMGGGLGMPPGHFLRMVGIASEESGAGPEEIGPAAPSLIFWPKNEQGMVQGAAAAAGLVELFGKKLGPYLKGVGKGLQPGGKLTPTFEELGVTGADYITKLKALREAGIDTTPEFKARGLVEDREVAGVVSAIEKLDKIIATIPIIQAKNVPGFFEGATARMEKGQPGQAEVNELRRAQAAYIAQVAFGPSAVRFLLQQIKRTKIGTELERVGFRDAFGYELQDESGAATKMGLFVNWMRETGKRAPTWGDLWEGGIAPIRSAAESAGHYFARGQGFPTEEPMTKEQGNAMMDLWREISDKLTAHWGTLDVDRLTPTPSE